MHTVRSSLCSHTCFASPLPALPTCAGVQTSACAGGEPQAACASACCAAVSAAWTGRPLYVLDGGSSVRRIGDCSALGYVCVCVIVVRGVSDSTYQTCDTTICLCTCVASVLSSTTLQSSCCATTSQAFWTAHSAHPMQSTTTLTCSPASLSNSSRFTPHTHRHTHRHTDTHTQTHTHTHTHTHIHTHTLSFFLSLSVRFSSLLPFPRFIATALKRFLLLLLCVRACMRACVRAVSFGFAAIAARERMGHFQHHVRRRWPHERHSSPTPHALLRTRLRILSDDSCCLQRFFRWPMFSSASLGDPVRMALCLPPPFFFGG